VNSPRTHPSLDLLVDRFHSFGRLEFNKVKALRLGINSTTAREQIAERRRLDPEKDIVAHEASIEAQSSKSCRDGEPDRKR